jgi:hypothetical protein
LEPTSDLEIHFVRQTLSTCTEPINIGLNEHDSDIVQKIAWVRQSHATVESTMFQKCRGDFGVMEHYYSSIVNHKDKLPATNHLFLEGAEFWFLYSNAREACDFRLLIQHLSRFAGHSLLTVKNPKQLFLAIGHAMIVTP